MKKCLLSLIGICLLGYGVLSFRSVPSAAIIQPSVDVSGLSLASPFVQKTAMAMCAQAIYVDPSCVRCCPAELAAYTPEEYDPWGSGQVLMSAYACTHYSCQNTTSGGGYKKYNDFGRTSGACDSGTFVACSSGKRCESSSFASMPSCVDFTCRSCETKQGGVCSMKTVANGSYNYSCVLTCNSGYAPVGGVCEPVPTCTYCQTYNATTNKCVTNTIANGYYGPSCGITCNPGFDELSGGCVAACKSCQYRSGGTCVTLSVANGSYNPSTCELSCNPTYTPSGGYCSLSFSCSSCTGGKQCNASQTACENTPAGTQGNCPSNYVADGAGNCVSKAACNPLCGTYTYNTCTLNAVTNGTYNASTCDITCDPGFQPESGACVPAPLVCRSCETYDPGSNSCLLNWTADGWYDAGTCALNCDPGFYPDSGACIPLPSTGCNLTCQTLNGMDCIRDASKTLPGGHGQYDGSNECRIFCDVGFTLSGTSCVPLTCRPGEEKIENLPGNVSVCVPKVFKYYDKKC